MTKSRISRAAKVAARKRQRLAQHERKKKSQDGGQLSSKLSPSHSLSPMKIDYHNLTATDENGVIHSLRSIKMPGTHDPFIEHVGMFVHKWLPKAKEIMPWLASPNKEQVRDLLILIAISIYPEES